MFLTNHDSMFYTQRTQFCGFFAKYRFAVPYESFIVAVDLDMGLIIERIQTSVISIAFAFVTHNFVTWKSKSIEDQLESLLDLKFHSKWVENSDLAVA